jgi:hypothetical protein
MNKKTRTAARTKLKTAKRAFTRAKAERLISRATDLSQLDDHRLQPVEGRPKLNKHVVAKLQKKRALLETGMPAPTPPPGDSG